MLINKANNDFFKDLTPPMLLHSLKVTLNVPSIYIPYSTTI